MPSELDILPRPAIVNVSAIWRNTGESEMMRELFPRSPFCVLAVSVLAATAVFAQGQKPAAKSYVLKAARMFDGKSDALVKPGLVVVTGDKIAGVGVAASVPAGAEVIDFGGATLLPGFIDAHTHLTSMYSEDYKQSALDDLQKTTAEKALDSSVNARVTLMAGVTTVRDVGSGEYLDAGLRNAIN